MSYGWRGVVGMVLPTYRVGSLERFIRMLPEGIGVIPVYGGSVQKGTESELRRALEGAEPQVALLAELGVDVIAIDGGPPLMLQGYRGAVQLVDRIQAKYGKPILTGPMYQIEAFQALGVRRPAGITYFPRQQNEGFTRFFGEAGYEVVAMEGYATSFADVGKVAPGELYAFAKKAFLRAKGADCIYIMGMGWDPLLVVAMLERDLGVPVVASLPAKMRAVLRSLNVQHPYSGYGRLLELP